MAVLDPIKKLENVQVLTYDEDVYTYLASRKAPGDPFQIIELGNPVESFTNSEAGILANGWGENLIILREFPKPTLTSVVGKAEAFVGYCADGKPVAAQKETRVSVNHGSYILWSVASAMNTFPTLEYLDMLYKIDLTTVQVLRRKDA